jgi:hypothetical protein
MASPGTPVPELGLLLVHGIGRQRAGEAVQEVANALLEWFAARGERQGLRARIADARLKDGQDPARATIEIRDAGDAPVGRLTLVESFWAEEFDPPGFLAVLRWMLGPGAWLLFRHVCTVPRRLFRRSLGIRPAGMVTTLASLVIGMAAIFLVVLPFQLFGVLLAAFWIIPFAPFREALAGAFLGIAERLGDSFVFARDPVVRRAIADRVARDLDRLDAERVVVVAHSQGAAVTLDMLEQHVDPPPLVTYGAGIRKLQELAGGTTDATPTPALFYALWVLAGLALAALVGVGLNLQQVAAGNLAPDPWAGMSFLVLAVLAIAGGSAGVIAGQRDDEVDESLRPRIAGLLARQPHWLDLFATDDFVPAGPLVAVAGYTEHSGIWTAPETGSLQCRQVVNQRDPLKDHVVYWANPAGFIDPVLAWIGRVHGIGWLSVPPPATGWLARPRRMGLRRLITVGLLILVVALWWRARPEWRALVPGADELAAWFVGKLPLAVGELPELGRGVTGRIYDGVTLVVALVLHVLAPSVYESAVTGPIWRSFDRQLALRPPTDTAGWAKALARLAAYLAVAGLTAVALLRAVEVGSYAPLWRVPAELLLKVHALL